MLALTFTFSLGLGYSRIYLTLFLMAKRPAPKATHTRKRRKGGTIYPVTHLELPGKGPVVEDVRIWDVSTSGKTGRVSASRRTTKHDHRVSNGFEEPPASEQPEAGDEVNVEDTGMLVDSEAPEKVEGHREKRHVGASKENDSVSRMVCRCSVLC